MTLKSGQRVGPYLVEEAAGAGGMGDVYKATDTRLNRTVAIKVVKGQFSERFEQEARAVASLSHPHICAIHDVGEHEGSPYLVMEYIEGKPLGGPLPVAKAIEYSKQILTALDVAHRTGLVHRDLKPANILVTKGGVKLLDFGLAKMLPKAHAASAENTMTLAITSENTILGTPQYMAPEQIEGKPADQRSDLFAFGCVFYEMLTGKLAFEGKSTASVMAAVLTAEPKPIREFQPLTPEPLERILRTCLAKDPDERWQSAREVRHALEWIETPSATATRGRRWWPLALGLAISFAVLAAALLMMPAVGKPDIVTFRVVPPKDVMVLMGSGGGLAISPDGRQLVYGGLERGIPGLWLYSFATGTSVRLPGIERVRRPFWSPDSREIAFISSDSLYRYALPSGPPRFLASANRMYAGAWSRAGEIILTGQDSITVVPADGGAAKRLQAENQAFFGNPALLPDGRRFLYRASIVKPPGSTGVFVGSLEENRLDLEKLHEESQFGFFFIPLPRRRPWEHDALFALAGTNSYTVRLADANTGQPRGPLLRLPRQTSIRTPLGVDGNVSNDGTLSLISEQVGQGHLVWYDREGRKLSEAGAEGELYSPSLSPYGKGILVERRVGGAEGNQYIWIVDSSGSKEVRLTNDRSWDGMPVWSPDGEEILFVSDRGSAMRVYRQSSTGLVEPTAIFDGRGMVTAWSPDKRYLLFTAGGLSSSGEDLFLYDLTLGKKVTFRASSGRERFGQFYPRAAPDGQYIAYSSDETGVEEIYVEKFQGATAHRVQISSGPAPEPRWRADGKELYYRADQKLWVVGVTLRGNLLEFSAPKKLFDAPERPIAGYAFSYDVAPDGKRFLFNAVVRDGAPEIVVVLNWAESVRRQLAGQKQ